MDQGRRAAIHALSRCEKSGQSVAADRDLHDSGDRHCRNDRAGGQREIRYSQNRTGQLRTDRASTHHSESFWHAEDGDVP
jgi:hypothetical protein